MARHLQPARSVTPLISLCFRISMNIFSVRPKALHIHLAAAALLLSSVQLGAEAQGLGSTGPGALATPGGSSSSMGGIGYGTTSGGAAGGSGTGQGMGNGGQSMGPGGNGSAMQVPNGMPSGPLNLNGDAAGASQRGASSNEGRSNGMQTDSGDTSRNRQSSRQAEAPLQFQTFVKQATGLMLPIYGQDLFSQPDAYRADATSPAPVDHLIGPGDELAVQVWGSVNYQGNLRVDRNGQISIPRIGPVNVAGVRVSEIGNTLRNSIGRTFRDFEVSATVGQLRSIQVYVVGQARQPGTYTLSSLDTLVNALFASGGPSSQGSMRNIQLKRNGKLVTTLDLYDFIGRGDKRNDVALQPGDVIVIPPAGPRVAFSGALDTPAIYELKPQADGSPSTVGDILSLKGGVPVLATSHKALIERVIPSMSPPRQVQDLTLDAQGLKQPLRDGDIVTLLSISPAFANAVTLQGNVAAPLRYRWFDGMRIRDLIPEQDALITSDYYLRKNLLVQNLSSEAQAAAVRGQLESSGSGDTTAEQQGVTNKSNSQISRTAGRTLDMRVRNMVDQINWDYAVIERLDKTKLRTQLIPFNLGRAVIQKDESQNLLLQPGDVVSILSQKDLKLPVERQTRLVRLEGEVAAPGLYEVQPGETLSDLLRRVGGLTPQAYVYGLAIDRDSVRKKQQENLDMLIRRLESQQQSQILFLLANRNSGDAASQAALMQQQQQLARNQLDALRKLQSNGRISLELNPENATLASLPELQLEDGDHIVVPATPGFVTATGAVNNENVFIYRPGRTVSDIVKVAGLREEADPDQMFVLRADGSIVSRNNAGSLFGWGGFESLKLMPGDALVVPEKLDRETTRNFIARQLKDWTQILSQFGLGVAAIKVIKTL